MSNRPGIYISYAHMDGMDVVRRLGFALSLYMDVYWDRRVQTGDYPQDLCAEIDSRDHFLLVMTPYALASEWCQKDMAYAQAQGKSIVLARIYAGAGTSDAALEAQYPCGDFSADFEAGFRKLTTTLLGQPFSSWESLSGAPTSVLLNYLKVGVIPTVVAKQVGEWVLVDKVWGAITAEIGAKRAKKLFSSTPLTATGLLTQCKALAEQLEKLMDKRNLALFKQIMIIAETCVDKLLPLPDNQHLAAGQLAYDILMQTKSLIEVKQTADRDYEKLHMTKTFFEFDAAEKIRAAIGELAWRLKSLY